LCKYVSESGEVQLKKEGEKKKAKSIVTWHRIECDGSVKKNNLNVLVYNHSKLRRSGMTCYFGPQPKAASPGTVEDNSIDLYDEGND